MFAMFSKYKTLLEWAGLLVVVLGIFYGVHKILAHEQQVGYDKAVAEYRIKQLAAEQSARAKEAELHKQLEEARNAAILRNQEIKKLSDIIAANSLRLRDTISDIRNKLPKATPEAINRTADTALSILGECQKEYGEMAENADRHASDVRMLEEAWPK